MTTPVFEFIRSLCYREDRPNHLAKTVTPEWLNELTWEGIAWWYQDDGSVSVDKNCAVAVFHTQGFPKEQVEMLAQMLTSRGIEASALQIRKGSKLYWIITLTAQSTRDFFPKIEKFVHQSMAYKLTCYQPKTHCKFCGNLIIVPVANLNLDQPCCKSRRCKLARNRERGLKWEQKLGKVVLNARSKTNRINRLEKNPGLQKKINQEQRQRFQDPVYREKWNAWKREWRQQRKLAGLPKM